MKETDDVALFRSMLPSSIPVVFIEGLAEGLTLGLFVSVGIAVGGALIVGSLLGDRLSVGLPEGRTLDEGS